MKTALACSALAITALVPVALSAPPLAAAPVVPVADASAMNGHGELAVIHNHALFLIGAPANGTNGVHYVGFGNRPSDPQWSYDGKWLSVVVTPPPYKHRPYVERPSFVALVGPRGKVYDQFPRGTDAYDMSTAWSPNSDRIAVSYTLHAKNPANDSDVLSIVTAQNGVADGLVRARFISGFAWSPDGSRLAADINGFAGSPGSWHSRLVTIDSANDDRHVVTRSAGNVFDVAGWWPDGSGILTWLDYQGSSSLAADGLPLLDISVANGHRRQLAKTMLQYPQWLATSAQRNEVAFVAGGDRELTLGHKDVRVCSLTSCRTTTQSDKQVSFDPAWSATGDLAFVRDQAVDPTHGFGGAYSHAVQASGGVLAGPTLGMIEAAPAGDAANAPTWGTDGSMLVVRNDDLWLLAPGLQSGVNVLSGLQVPSNYYGFVPWHESFAWTDAVPQ